MHNLQGHPVREQAVSRTLQPPVHHPRSAQLGGRNYTLMIHRDVEAELSRLATADVTLPMLWQAVEIVAIYERTVPDNIIVDRATVERLNKIINPGSGVDQLVLVAPRNSQQTIRSLITSPQLYLQARQVADPFRRPLNSQGVLEHHIGNPDRDVPMCISQVGIPVRETGSRPLNPPGRPAADGRDYTKRDLN